jgi:hypothetical protein
MTSYQLSSGVLAIFLYDEPFGHQSTEAEMRQHLEVLESFVAAWNDNNMVWHSRDGSQARLH